MILNIFFIGYLEIEHSIWALYLSYSHILSPNYKGSLIFFSNSKLIVANGFVK